MQATKFQELKVFEVKSFDIIMSCSWVYLWKLPFLLQNNKK